MGDWREVRHCPALITREEGLGFVFRELQLLQLSLFAIFELAYLGERLASAGVVFQLQVRLLLFPVSEHFVLVWLRQSKPTHGLSAGHITSLPGRNQLLIRCQVVPAQAGFLD